VLSSNATTFNAAALASGGADPSLARKTINRRSSASTTATPSSLALPFWICASKVARAVSRLTHAVWQVTAGSDSALTSCIQELRHVQRDNARQPRFVETLHRSGYRFVARVSAGLSDRLVPAVTVPSPRANVPFVGREPTMQAMLKAWALAEQGTRQVLFVTGEPGVGKRTAVSAFLARVGARDPIRTTWAPCVQHFGIDPR